MTQVHAHPVYVTLPALLAACAGLCSAAIGNLRVIGATATQAIVSYTAPDQNPCTIQVSESSSLAPLVHDVDPAIFTGANQDSRPGNIGSRQTRVAVIGKRSAELATAGQYAGVRHFSRALQANTAHFGLVQCAADMAPFTFTTTNIPLGSTYGDPWLQDPRHPGDQPWPESVGGTTPESFIDPLTGALLVRIGLRSNDYSAFVNPPLPGSGSGVMFGSAYNQGQSPCDSGGNWTNPCGKIVLGGSGNTTIGNSAGVLVLRPPLTPTQSLPNGWQSYSSFWTLDQLAVYLTGSVSSGKTVLNVCLSMNSGASCANTPQKITFSTSSSKQTAGQFDVTKFGVASWILDSNPRINMQGIAPNSGTDTVSGNTVTWATGSNFWSLNWITGGNGRIRLSTLSAADACAVPGSHSSEYTITGFTDGLHINVTPAPPAGANFWCADNFAVMVWRDSPDSNTVTLTAASIGELQGEGQPYSDNGTGTGCMNTPVQSGFFCLFGGLYWINPETGAVVYYGYMVSTNPGITNTWSTVGMIPNSETANIDQTQSVLTFYFVSGDPAGGGPLVIRGVFNPTSITQPAAPYPNGSQIGNATVTGTTAYSQTWSNGLTFTNMTPQNPGGTCETIVCQMAAFDSTFNPTFFGTAAGGAHNWNCAPYGESVSIFYFVCYAGYADSAAWIFAFSPGDGNPAHAHAAGGPQVMGAINTFNTPNGPVAPSQTAFTGRSLHALAETGETGWVSINTHSYPPVNTSATAVPASSKGSPCASFGLPGNAHECIQLTIVNHTSGAPCVTGCTGYEPYYPSPQFQFTGAPGELRTTQVGDTVCVAATSLGNCTWNIPGKQELMTLVQKNAGGVWVFQRNSYGTEVAATAPLTLYWQSIQSSLPPGALSQVGAMTAYWSPTAGCGGSPDPHGNCLLQDNNETESHLEMRDGGGVQAINVPAWNVLDWNSWPTDYQTMVGAVPEILGLPFANDVPGSVAGVNYTSYSPPFAGAWGHPWTGEAGTHPNPGGANSPVTQAFDNVPFQGGGHSPALVNVTGQLYVATPSNMSDPDDSNWPNGIPSINRKLMATGASCGAHPLIDKSGPGSSIATDITGSYTYCDARANGECRAGSTVGQIYVNCPGVLLSGKTAGCNGNSFRGGVPMGVGNDICIGNQGIAQDAIRQFSLDQTDEAGAYTRTLVTATSWLRMVTGFENNRVLPDNSWLLFRAEFLDYQSQQMWMAKLPPYPSRDNIDRGTFVPMVLKLQPPAGVSVDNTVVEFGYTEYSGNCTTRKDSCLANAATVGTTPFFFASENPKGMSCSSGCTIALPAISQRVLYYQVEYRDKSNHIVAVSPSQAVAVP